MKIYVVACQNRGERLECVDSFWWAYMDAEARCESLDPGPHRVIDVDIQGGPPWIEHDASPDSPEMPGAKCPFLNYVGGLGIETSARCSHPARDEFVVNLCYGDVKLSTEAMGGVPDDCPLRRRPVLVRMKGD